MRTVALAWALSTTLAGLVSFLTLGIIYISDGTTTSASWPASCDPTLNRSCVVHSNGTVYDVCFTEASPMPCTLPSKRRRRRLETAREGDDEHSADIPCRTAGCEGEARVAVATGMAAAATDRVASAGRAAEG